MYRQPITSSVPGRSTVKVKPVRSVKSRACRSKSRRLASSDMPSTGGQPQDSKPGVARMCAMLDVHAAWSDSLCCAPSGTRWNSGSSSSRGGSKSSGTKGLALTTVRLPPDQNRLASRYQLHASGRSGLGNRVADMPQDARLFERDVELAALVGRLDSLTAAGTGGVVLVEGVAGIGKSSLLR